MRALRFGEGGALLHRRWRRIEVTASGRRLTDCARSVLAELQRAEHEAQELLRGTAGTIRLATACYESYDWLPGLLKTFHEQLPGVEVTVVPPSSTSLSEQLLGRQVAVVLTTSDAERAAQLRYQRLFSDELVAVVSRAHPWSGRSSVPLADLADQHLWIDAGALHPKTALSRALLRARAVWPKKVTFAPNGSRIAVEMARVNLGITIVPAFAARRLSAEGDLAVVRWSRCINVTWVIATRKETPEPPLASFLGLLGKAHPGASAASGGRKRPRSTPSASTLRGDHSQI